MCRSIKRLRPVRGSDLPPATPEEVQAAALQFVRKVSGIRVPTAVTHEAFDAAVNEVAATTARLIAQLETASARRPAGR